MLSQPSNRQRLAWLLFTLFALMQVNLVLFRHGHRLPDGRIITHAHPFWPDGKGPIKANPHSAAELALLDAVANGAFFNEPAFALCFQPVVFVKTTVNFAETCASFSRPVFRFLLRGPPAVQ